MMPTLNTEGEQKDPREELQSFEADVDAIYERIRLSPAWELPLGIPAERRVSFAEALASHRFIIVGAELGDEGKGRLIDNLLQYVLKDEAIKTVVVVRFQGGSNAGHTLEKDGVRLAMHQVPSIAFEPKAIGIMDRGMVIHAEDLQMEVGYIEEAVGRDSLRGRLFLSTDAMLVTDIERSLEVFYREKAEGVKGGTSRGIGPTYAGRHDRMGLTVADLLKDDWRNILSNHYDWYTKTFMGHGKSLAEQLVPDFRASVEKKSDAKRTVGSKEVFLNRLEKARQWLMDREMVPPDMHAVHAFIKDHADSIAVIAEGAQGIGLSVNDGTIPDISASDTSVYGIKSGTKSAWLPEEIPVRIGVWKGTYMSSVGARRMPTHIDLPKTVLSETDLPASATAQERRAARIRRVAREYGTTTGRPRDICHTDLAFMKYNVEKGGINMLAATHMDVTQEGEKILVCTHYTRGGQLVRYQPGLSYIEGVVPHYKEFDGWDGTAAQKAKSFDELPQNARRYLAFIQAYTGVPVVMATTGPERAHIIEFPQYQSYPENVADDSSKTNELFIYGVYLKTTDV